MTLQSHQSSDASSKNDWRPTHTCNPGHVNSLVEPSRGPAASISGFGLSGLQGQFAERVFITQAEGRMRLF